MNHLASLSLDTIRSPLGDIQIVWDDDGLHLVEFAEPGPRLAKALSRLKIDGGRRPHVGERIAHTPYSTAFGRYFEGELTALLDLPMVLSGSPFQLKVWNALRRIPVGTITTYGELVRSIGHRSAGRAVGSANAQNPIAVAIPCHRVIGVDGNLVGYGGGLDRKRWLLAHEKAL